VEASCNESRTQQLCRRSTRREQLVDDALLSVGPESRSRRASSARRRRTILWVWPLRTWHLRRAVVIADRPAIEGLQGAHVDAASFTVLAFATEFDR